MAQVDEQFFKDHRDRKVRIRMPLVGECVKEFLTLGPHDVSRRRIIALNMAGNRMALRNGMRVMCVPFLQFADETIEDTDAVLLPMVDEMMRGAAAEHGMVKSVN